MWITGRFVFAWKMLLAAQIQDEYNDLRRKRAALRRMCDPFELGETELRKRYRLSKGAVLHLCKKLKQVTDLKSTQRLIASPINVIFLLNE